jgi:MoaA/NifB/PqqE/SkfB family radical SAM enzyme
MIGRILGLLHQVAANRCGLVGRPRFMTYAVTFACNARCVMCDSWRKPRQHDLSLAEIERIFDQLPRMDAVRLTGGEPFLRRDLVEIAGLVHRKLRPLVLHITTNGFLTDRIVDFCTRRGKRPALEMLVSIDGVGDKHNQVRGSRNAWQRAMRTLHTLAPQQKELNLRLAVNQTIVDAEGVEQYRRLRDILRPLGVGHHMVMAYQRSATYDIQPQVELAPTAHGEFVTFGRFTRRDLSELFDAAEADLAHMSTGARLAKRFYLDGVRNRLLDNVAAPNPRCVALRSHLRILPSGDVPTCQFNSKTVGNLRQDPFDELWHGSSAGQQRRWVDRCPGCWAECEVVPNAIYTLDLLRQCLWKHRRPGPSQGNVSSTRANTGSC